MHSDGSERQRVNFGECAFAHECCCHWRHQEFRGLQKLFGSVGSYHSSSCEDQGFFCLSQQLCSFFDLQRVRVRWGFVAANFDFVRKVHLSDCVLHVFGQINQDWSWSACGGYVERRLHGSRNLGGFSHLIVIFGYGRCYSDDVCFLEGVSAYHVGSVSTVRGNLAC